MMSSGNLVPLDYWLCDVFTETRFAGNQLAVFPDAAHLSAEQMQTIAREMNLSETTFVLRREAAVEREHGIRVRIFTTQEELPFAGHPTLGTASMLRKNFPEFRFTGPPGQGDEADIVVLELNAGRVPVRFDASRTLFGEMTQPDAVFGQQHDALQVAPLLGLRVEDLSPELPAIQTVSTGVPFCIVPLRDVEALSRLQLDARRSAEYLATADAKFFYCIAPVAKQMAGAGEPHFRARMQFYNAEDPATGSAAGCAISYLVHHGVVASDQQVHLRQGVEMRRASDLFLRAQRQDSNVREVRVAGSTVPVAIGQLFLE